LIRRKKIVYVDTNIISHMVNLSDGITPRHVSVFEHFASEKIIIPISLVTIEELIMTFRTNPDLANALIGQLARIVCCRNILKPLNRILSEEVRCFAKQRKRYSPYLKRSSKFVDKIVRFISTGHSSEELESTLEEIQTLKDQFYENMSKATSAVRDDLGIRKNRRLPNFQEGRPPSFEEFFQLQSIMHAERIAKREGMLRKCQILGIERLIQIPTVRVFSGIISSLIYSQIIENRNLQGSHSYDLKHAVLGSVADIFLTNDKELTRLINRIPDRGFEICRLQDYVVL